MSMQLALNTAGGFALFMLAMHMMTEGLKTFGGGRLKQTLGSWTSSPTRGVLAGFLFTGLIQSSGAVTVAAIGFVNAAMLSLRQGLGLIFGANIGTTTTAWLVTLIGFGFKIELLALPILTVGVVLRMMFSGKRVQGLGEALAGFGLFFLGLAILKEAFGGLAGTYTATVAGNDGGWTTFLVVGFVATVLTQSSSASIALLITAVMGGVVGLEAAALMVIGANVGSTSTAVFAALKATPAAKRLAVGHVVFNVVTGIAALMILPLMLWSIREALVFLNLGDSLAATLAVFHTVFNVLGVLLLLPFVTLMSSLLERMFRSDHEDLGRPRHLDPSTASIPEIAASAVREELLRLRSLAAGVMSVALSGGNGTNSQKVLRQAAAVQQLGEAIGAYVGTLRTEVMPRDVEKTLTQYLRVGRYLGEAARLTHYVDSLRRDAASLADRPTGASVAQVLARALDCARLAGATAGGAVASPENGGDRERSEALELFAQSYEHTKVALLAAAVAQSISVETTDALLAELSATRRAVDQLVKGDRLLRTPAQAAAIEARDELEESTVQRGIRGDDLRNNGVQEFESLVPVHQDPLLVGQRRAGSP